MVRSVTKNVRVSGFFLAAETIEENLEQILETYLNRLHDTRSPLVAEARMREQLKAQTRNILEDAARNLRGLGDHTNPATKSKLCRTIGETRAQRGVHPAEMLSAVSALSRATLSVVVDKLSASPITASEATNIVLTLQQLVIERAAMSSVSYMGYLLRKINSTHTDERWRIARELHDRVSHSLATARQSLELHELLEPHASSRAENTLRYAKEQVEDSLRSIRAISQDLGGAEEKELEVALSNILRVEAVSGIRAWLVMEGDPDLIPSYTRDELLLVLRHGIRYLVGRTKVDRLRLVVRISPTGVAAVAETHLPGSDSPGPDSAEDIRLESLRERAALFGGTVGLYLVPSGAGTRLEIDWPLAGVAPEPSAEFRSRKDEATRVVLADDHANYRRSLAEMLAVYPQRVEIAGETGTDIETVALARSMQPDVVLLDVEIPAMGAREAIREILGVSPSSRVIVLSMYEDARLARSLLSQGATAYVSKGAAPGEILSAMRAVENGRPCVILAVDKTDAQGGSVPTNNVLSGRELEILAHVARKMSNKEVGRRLHISEVTVKRHLANIYTKLGVSSREEATAKALAEGLITTWALANAR